MKATAHGGDLRLSANRPSKSNFAQVQTILHRPIGQDFDEDRLNMSEP
jgi:hypothetical protein